MLEQYAADHRYLLAAAGRQAGFADPVAVHLDEFDAPLLKAARRGPVLPLNGVLVRDWDPDDRRTSPGVQHRHAPLRDRRHPLRPRPLLPHDNLNGWGLDFVAVDRKDYRRLYRIALRCRREQRAAERAAGAAAGAARPALEEHHRLSGRDNLDRIKAYGGRAKRGVLLTGSPGNGKTMACRWIWEACRQRRWEYRLVTPDNYRGARTNENVEELFSVERRGIVFFDDMDLALRDRDKIAETEDQAVFLSAMDGINVQRRRGVRLHDQLLAGPDRPGVQAARPARPGAAFQGAGRRPAPPADRALARGHPGRPRRGRGRSPRRTATVSRRSRS